MTLEQTQRRRQAVETIHDVVSAMRAIAAGRIQHAQQALAAARRYAAVVHRAVAALEDEQAMLDWPAVESKETLIVLTSEQPLCGSFNHDVLDLAERRWNELRQQSSVWLVVVGHRGGRQLAARGIRADHAEAAANSLAGLRTLLKRLAGLVSHRLSSGELGTLRVIYNRYQSISEQIPTEERILPPDLAALRKSASPRPAGRFDRFLPESELLAGLISEHALISLYQQAAESFASEQASRLVAMDAATRNTDRIAEALMELEQRERQGDITRQVLELIAARFTVE